MKYEKSKKFNDDNLWVLDQLINHAEGPLNDKIIIHCDYRRNENLNLTLEAIHNMLRSEEIIIPENEVIVWSECFPYGTIDKLSEDGINYYSMKAVITDICEKLQIVIHKNKIKEIIGKKTIEDLENHFLKIDKLRKSIVEVSTLFPRLTDTPNPFYGVIPFDGSLILCESYNNPSSFYTPIGKFSITGGGCSEGYTTIDILEQLGIKYTRLTEMVVSKNGCFGGLIQIDEDQFGNIYPPVDTTISINGGIFGEEYYDLEHTDKETLAIKVDYHACQYLFTKIEEKYKLLEKK